MSPSSTTRATIAHRLLHLKTTYLFLPKCVIDKGLYCVLFLLCNVWKFVGFNKLCRKTENGVETVIVLEDGVMVSKTVDGRAAALEGAGANSTEGSKDRRRRSELRTLLVIFEAQPCSQAPPSNAWYMINAEWRKFGHG